MKKQKFSLQNRLKSFSYAFNGLKVLFKEEHNARIHLLVTILVIILGLVFQVSLIEWIILIFAIGFVLISEIINTAIEQIADFISPQKHPKIKIIKDLAAASVLISSICAFVVGLIIFIPKIMV